MSPMSEGGEPKQDSQYLLKSPMSEDFSRFWLSFLGSPPSDIGDISRFWLSCLGSPPSDIGDFSGFWLSCQGSPPSDIGDLVDFGYPA
jgi:hypothetical protein